MHRIAVADGAVGDDGMAHASKQDPVPAGTIDAAADTVTTTDVSVDEATPQMMKPKRRKSTSKSTTRRNSSPNKRKKEGTPASASSSSSSAAAAAAEGNATRRKSQDKKRKFEKDDDLSIQRPASRKNVKKSDAATVEDGTDVLELPEFERFGKALEALFQADDNAAVYVSNETQSGSAANNKIIKLLRSELAKVHEDTLFGKIETRMLSRMITLLAPCYTTASRITLDEDSDDDDAKALISALEGCVATMYVMVAPGSPMELCIEEIVEQILIAINHQLKCTVYPAKSPEASLDPSKKRKSTERAGIPSKHVLNVYNSVCVLIELCSRLLDKQVFADSLVLQITKFSISPFFEFGDLNQLQIHALDVARKLFGMYPEHQEVILQDILGSIAKIPTGTTKQLRTFKLSKNKAIQMTTALVVQLVQSTPCITRGDNLEERGKEALNTYDQAEKICNTFLQTLIVKCGPKKDEVDYKAIFANFVEDVLRILNHPEWPAAELFMFHIVRLLLPILSQSKKALTTAPMMKTLAVDLLGPIAAKIHKEKIMTGDDVTLSSDTKSKNCACGDACDERHFLVQCLGCERKFHGDCVEISDQSSVPEDWQCFDCAERSRRLEGEESQDETLRRQTLQDTLTNFLEGRIEEDPSCFFARSFYLAQWISEDQIHESEAEEESSGKRRKELLHSGVSTGNKGRTCSTYEARSIAAFLATRRQLGKADNNILRHLLSSLSETDTRMRQRALKALMIMAGSNNSDLLLQPDVKRAVHQRFLDKQIMVREAAVDLIGKVVLSKPELAEEYCTVFLNRVVDLGTSVRKRAIKVLRDVCTQQQDFKYTHKVCFRFLQRMDDTNEPVKELAVRALQDIMFADPLEQQDAVAVWDNRASILCAMLSERERPDEDCSSVTLRNLQKITSKLLVDGDRKQMQHALASLTERLVAKMIRKDEESSETNVSKVIYALYALCNACPQVMAKHFSLLLPYLQTSLEKLSAKEHRETCTMITYAAKMMTAIIPTLEHPSDSVIKSLEETLSTLIFNSPPQVVEASIICLAASVKHISENYVLARDTLKRFYLYLKEEWEGRHAGGNGLDRKPHILRALYVCGLFCRYLAFDEEDEEASDPATRDLDMNNIRDVVFLMQYQFASCFVGKSGRKFHNDICLKALAGLGSLLMAYPFYWVREEVVTLCTDIFEDTRVDSTKMKHQLLRNLKDFLLNEEKRLLEAEEQNKNAGSKKVEAKLVEFGGVDSGLSSTVIYTLQDHILTCGRSPDTELRLAAMHVLTLTVRQGLVNPMECVPSIIALTCDTSPKIRKQAKHILEDMDEKYHQFVLLKAIDGVMESYQLRKGSSGSDEVRGFLTSQEDNSKASVMAPLYKLMRLKKARHTFLKQVFGRLLTAKSLHIVVYLAEVLAYLPFTQQEEPLFVIYHINKTTAIEGNSLIEKFANTFGVDTFDLDDERELDIDIANFPKENSRDLATLCVEAKKLGVLLLLGQFLQKVFGLSITRCVEYHPTQLLARENSGKSHRKSGTLNLELLECAEDVKRLSLPEMVAVYQMFNQLMVHQEAAGDAAILETEDAPTKQASTPSTSRRSSVASSKRSQPRRRSAKRRKRKPRYSDLSASEDDEDDDDEWRA